MQLELFTQELGAWSYLALALLVMVEGPVATLAGAVASSAGLMQPEGVFFAAASGNLMADILWYALGFLGRIEWLERAGRWVGLSAGFLEQIRGDIFQHSGRLLLVSKLTLGFSIPTLVATGLSRVPVRRWLPSLLFGETIWTSSLVFLGYHFGRYVQTMERSIQWIAFGGVFLFSALIIVYLSRVHKRARAEKAEPARNIILRQGDLLNSNQQHDDYYK